MRDRCRQGGPVFGRVSVQVGDVGLLLTSVVQQWHRFETLPAALVPNTLGGPTKGTGVACSRRRVSDDTVVVLDAQALRPDGYVRGTSVKCLLHLADVCLVVRAQLSLLKGKSGNAGRDGPVVLALVPYLLHCVVHHLRVKRYQVGFRRVYLERVFGIDEAALEFASLVRVRSVGVDQRHKLWKPPELSHLQVNIVQASNQDPHLEVVELSERAKELEKGLKDDGPLLVVEVVVETGPGCDSEGHRSGHLRRKKELGFTFGQR